MLFNKKKDSLNFIESEVVLLIRVKKIEEMEKGERLRLVQKGFLQKE
jgi:hypothetical protein